MPREKPVKDAKATVKSYFSARTPTTVGPVRK